MEQDFIYSLLTKSPEPGGCHLEKLVSESLFFFSLGELRSNEFYNHYAFEISQNLLYTLTKSETNPRQKIVLGLFLVNGTKWNFINAELASVLSKLDELCKKLLSIESSLKIIDLIWIIIYLGERNSTYYRKEIDDQFEIAIKLLDHQQKAGLLKIDDFNQLNASLIAYLEKKNQQIEGKDKYILSLLGERLNGADKSVNITDDYKKWLDKGFEQLVSEDEKYKEQQEFHQALF